jgi:CubicO group peptidase (beta-lactamase class C family)
MTLRAILVMAVLLVAPRLAQAAPDGHAAKQFAAWLEVFNKGDRAALLAYHQRAFPYDVASRDVGDVEREFGLSQGTGGFDLVKAEEATATTFTALLKERRSDQHARAVMRVASAAPHNVTAFEIHPIATPAGLEPKHLGNAELIEEIKKTIAQHVANDDFAGAVLIAKSGKPIFTDAVGLADREHKVANTLKSRFRLGSMNKMVTAVSTLQLVQAGKIALDAPLGKYLPDYPNKEIAKVTIHQLLTHTGGTGDFFGPEFDAHRLELRTHSDYLKLFGTRAPEFAPGSRWKYSNYGFLLLGAIIEGVSGQSYYDYVQQHVYAPAGMTSTGSEPEERAVPDRSVGYTKMDGSNQWKPNTDTLPYRGMAAGGGYSTVEDLLRFANALQQHKLLDAKHTELLTTGKVDTPGGRYAYGFQERIINGTRCFGHGGGAPGMNGELDICDGGYVVLVLANLDPPAAHRIGEFITNRLPASGAPAKVQPLALDGPAAKQFAAWLAAFNKEDKVALRAYHDQLFPYSAWPEMSLEREYALSVEGDGFEVKEVETATATTYSALLMDRATHFFAGALMQVETTAPYRVVSFDLRPVDKPEKYREAERPLDGTRRRQLLDAMTRAIDANYVFPDVGTRMIAAIHEHAKRGDYDKISDCTRFAELLTEQLQGISHDKHLRLIYGEPKPPHPPKPDPHALGFGFGTIDRLPGNIAHVVIHSLGRLENVRAPIVGFMGRVADADALILDLRDNTGGDPHTEALVASFLFDNTPVHLLDFVSRDGTSTPLWTTPDVGNRFGGRKPIYVLTSSETISGGEALAYDLQTHKRATLVGETTIGAANPAGGHTLDDWFVLFVPGARPINPITKTNWEGIGVKPDVATKADAAFDEALRRVRRDLHR